MTVSNKFVPSFVRVVLGSFVFVGVPTAGCGGTSPPFTSGPTTMEDGASNDGATDDGAIDGTLAEAADGGGGEGDEAVDRNDGPTDASTDATAPSDAEALVPVTFTYTPQWDGVKRVDVLGRFGQSTDWSSAAPFLALTKSAGAYTGLAYLPPGSYPYVFRIVGDALAASPATYARYAVDPLAPAFAACPAESPTFSKVDANPCSVVTVSQAPMGPAADPVHVVGGVVKDGSPAAGWIVLLEREEPMSHHFFANRMTCGADGRFDLIASTGSYRLQIQHPTLLSENDLNRDPGALAALRRAISAPFALFKADKTVPTPDVAFHSYPLFAPVGDAGALPTAFSFETGEARLDVYGGPGDGGAVEIGDPWFASEITRDGGAVFSGVFNTKQATEDAAAPGARYLWGTEQAFDADAGGGWTMQSMVFPIAWQ